MKTLQDLINNTEPAWTLITEWLKNANNPFEVLARDTERAETELVTAQVTTRSPMGAVIYETGGILIDNGWLRILGSGNDRLDRGLMIWNKGKSYNKMADNPLFLLIADDVVGGYFALNTGYLAGSIGSVYYLAPDTLAWEDLECGYADFLQWALKGDLAQFYENVRWKDWQNDLKQIGGDEMFTFYPYLWTKEGQDVNKNTRKIISIEEHYQFTIEIQREFHID